MSKSNKLRELIIAEVETHKMVSTWHLNELIDKAALIMGWDNKNFKKCQRNLRHHLNKMVDEGTLTKRRCGTGYLGKTDFGVCHLNFYTKPDFWN